MTYTQPTRMTRFPIGRVLVLASAIVLSNCGAPQPSFIRAEATPVLNVGQSPGPQYGATLEQYYQPSDGSDWSPAFQRFLAGDIGKLRLSCLKTYAVSSTVNICRPVIIEGCGTAGGGSIIRSAQGVTAFAVRSDAYCPGAGVDGSGSRLKDLFVQEANGSSALTQRFGVLMEAPAVLDRVRIWNFSNGVRVDADDARAGSARSNADAWSITNVTVNNSDHAGVIAIGANTSNGLVDKLNVTSNCWDVDKVTAGGAPLYPINGSTAPIFPTCAGFIDSSKWGNTWVVAHASNNKDAILTGSATQTTYYPPGRFLDSARGVCVGCYQENQGIGAPGYVDAIELNSLSIGLSGEAEYTGGGTAIYSQSTPALRADNLSLVAPLIVPQNTSGNYPILIRIWNTNNEPDLRIEQDNSPAANCAPNCGRLRGSYLGANSQVAWRWIGDPASWTGL